MQGRERKVGMEKEGTPYEGRAEVTVPAQD